MPVLSWAVLAIVLAATGGALVWAAAVLHRRAGRARRVAERWTHFAETCPTAEPDAGAETFALLPPGHRGGVSVKPDGLCLTLDHYAGRTFWLTWTRISGLDPDPSGGAMLRLGRGVEVHLPALACRAIWAAKARVGRPQSPAATAS